MDKLGNILSDLDYIFFKPITKLFFGKYPFKVELYLERYVTKELNNNDISFQKFRGIRFEYGMRQAEQFCKTLTSSYKTRRQGPFGSFYFETEDDAVGFILTNKPYVTLVSAPETEDQIQELLTDSTVRIRTNLFWGKYKWCVRLKSLSSDQFETIKEWCKDSFLQDFKEERYLLCSGYPFRAYFNNEIDLLQFKMMVSENIFLIEKAILREEICQ